MQSKTSLIFVLLLMVVYSPPLFADSLEAVHSAFWMPYPHYDGPMDTGGTSPSWPTWATAQAIAKRYPNRQNLALASWCNSAEEQLLKAFRGQAGWSSGLEKENCHCVFSINSDGQIQDPFFDSDGDVLTEKLVLDALLHAGRFPNPPAYLSQRRLKICLLFPKILLCVDFNERKDDDRNKYLESIKAYSQKRLLESK
jgi:hypothetical protein